MLIIIYVNRRAFGDTLAVLPLHHTFGLVTSVFCTLYGGSCVCINSNIKNLMREFAEFKPQSMWLVPMYIEGIYKRIWDIAKKQKRERGLRLLFRLNHFLFRIGIDVRKRLFRQVLSAFGGNLAVIASGGAPLDNKYVGIFRDMGIDLLNGYGISECSPVVSSNTFIQARDHSVGQAFPCCEVKTINENEDGIGEICVRGENVMLGYYRMPEETENAFVDDWFRTGDLGYIDEEGFIFITGRIKNLIILKNGKNIYPEELEMQLLQIPRVVEVVVSAEGEKIVAEIYPEADRETIPQAEVTQIEESIKEGIDALNQTLPPYKCITRVHFRDREFEKTTSRKIRRR